MSEIETLIIFFVFLFTASLLYSRKKKRESLFSYLINLELEYVIVGVVLFFLTDKLPIPITTMNGIMYLLLAFMGLALGTHFSIKLLMTVPYRFFIFSGIIYIVMIPLLYIVLLNLKCRYPLMMSIALNTLMPYSVNLTMKLFRVPKDKVFISNLTASLFPLITLLAYTFAAGVEDYRPVDFMKSFVSALALAAVFLHYGKIRSKKSVHNLSILFVVLISGIAVFYKISPLVLGFLVGFVTSDTKYGNIFQNMSITFERILYIFFYVALGVMLAYGFTLSFEVVITAGGIYVCFMLVRMVMAKVLAERLMPTKGELIMLVSTGILPAVMLLDFGSRHGYESVAGLFGPFFLVHLATEITTYLMMKNERKTD
jgi:hypothetical protein